MGCARQHTVNRAGDSTCAQAATGASTATLSLLLHYSARCMYCTPLVMDVRDHPMLQQHCVSVGFTCSSQQATMSCCEFCLPRALQLELSARLDCEHLEGSLAETAANKQRLSEQLAAAQQVSEGWLQTPVCAGILNICTSIGTCTLLVPSLNVLVPQELVRLSAEAAQLRAALEEARAATEEARKGRAAAQVRKQSHESLPYSVRHQPGWGCLSGWLHSLARVGTALLLQAQRTCLLQARFAFAWWLPHTA